MLSFVKLNAVSVSLSIIWKMVRGYGMDGNVLIPK